MLCIVPIPIVIVSGLGAFDILYVVFLLSLIRRFYACSKMDNGREYPLNIAVALYVLRVHCATIKIHRCVNSASRLLSSLVISSMRFGNRWIRSATHNISRRCRADAHVRVAYVILSPSNPIGRLFYLRYIRNHRLVPDESICHVRVMRKPPCGHQLALPVVILTVTALTLRGRAAWKVEQSVGLHDTASDVG